MKDIVRMKHSAARKGGRIVTQCACRSDNLTVVEAAMPQRTIGGGQCALHIW